MENNEDIIGKTNQLLVKLAKTETEMQLNQIESQNRHLVNTYLFDIIKDSDRQFSTYSDQGENFKSLYMLEYNKLLEKYQLSMATNNLLEKEVNYLKIENASLRKLNFTGKDETSPVILKDEGNWNIFENKLNQLEDIYKRKIAFLTKSLEDQSQSYKNLINEASEFIKVSFKKYEDEIHQFSKAVPNLSNEQANIKIVEGNHIPTANYLEDDATSSSKHEFDFKLLETKLHSLELKKNQLEEDNLLLIAIYNDFLRSLDVTDNYSLAKKKKYLTIDSIKYNRRNLLDAYGSDINEIKSDYGKSFGHINLSTAKAEDNSNETKQNQFADNNANTNDNRVDKIEYLLSIKDKEIQLKDGTIDNLNKFNQELMDNIIQKEKRLVECNNKIEEKDRQIEELNRLRKDINVNMSKNTDCVVKLHDTLRNIFTDIIDTNKTIITSNLSPIINELNSLMSCDDPKAYQQTSINYETIKKLAMIIIDLNKKFESRVTVLKNIIRTLKSRNSKLVKEILSYNESGDVKILERNWKQIKNSLLRQRKRIEKK